MVRYILIGLLFLVGWNIPAQAQRPFGNKCQDFGKTNFSLDTQYDKVSLDKTKTIDEITKITKLSQRGSANGQFNVLLGAAVSKIMIGYKAQVAYRDFGSQVCAKPENVEFTLQYVDNKIYISKEAARKRCTYNEVLAHEKRHVKVDQSQYRRSKAQISRYLRKLERQVKAENYSSTAAANAAIQAQLQKIAQTIQQNLVQENAALQAKIDTPQEYARLSSKCNGAFSEIARKNLQNKRR